MSFANPTKVEASDLLDSILNFVSERYTKFREIFGFPTDWAVWKNGYVCDVLIPGVYKYLKEEGADETAQEIIVAALTRHFRENYDCHDAITEEFEKWVGTTTDTEPVKPKTRKTTKKDTPMATNNTNNQINVADLIKVKMMEKLMDGDTKDLNLGKMTVVQALANGQAVDFGEVMKAKMTEKLLKAVEADEDIPLGKLLMLQAMTTNPNFGINDLVQLKLMEKFLDEPEAKTK